MICGKIAAGKSTLARRLADAPATILISEDIWLATLYRDEQRTVAEYARNARRLREVMGGHIEDLLRAGLSVVLDFPANTVANRQWMRGLFEKAGARHRLSRELSPSDPDGRAGGGFRAYSEELLTCRTPWSGVVGTRDVALSENRGPRSRPPRAY